MSYIFNKNILKFYFSFIDKLWTLAAKKHVFSGKQASWGRAINAYVDYNVEKCLLSIRLPFSQFQISYQTEDICSFFVFVGNWVTIVEFTTICLYEDWQLL